MVPALALAAYAVVAAWCLPAPLARLTARGVNVRTGLVTWLAGMTSVLVSLGLAFYFISRTLRADWPQLTQTVCREVAGDACTPAVYGSAAYELGLAAFCALACCAAVVAAWRYGRRVNRARKQTRAHGQAARIVGRALPGTDAVVLDDPRPAAYCAAGTIVVTSGALGVLDDDQLAAVLAHERGHLRGRHHLLTLVLRGLTAAFPGVPLFTRGPAEVARLAEMSADDTAARTAGRPALITALIAIATGQAARIADPEIPDQPAERPLIPGGVLSNGLLPDSARTGSALAAATIAVQARVERLLHVPTRPCIVAATVSLTAITIIMTALPAVIVALASW
jgi:Zn-dependent protease with chaperone function